MATADFACKKMRYASLLTSINAIVENATNTKSCKHVLLNESWRASLSMTATIAALATKREVADADLKALCQSVLDSLQNELAVVHSELGKCLSTMLEVKPAASIGVVEGTQVPTKASAEKPSVSTQIAVKFGVAGVDPALAPSATADSASAAPRKRSTNPPQMLLRADLERFVSGISAEVKVHTLFKPVGGFAGEITDLGLGAGILLVFTTLEAAERAWTLFGGYTPKLLEWLDE